MAVIDFEIKDFSKVAGSIKTIPKESFRAVVDELIASGEELRNEMILSMRNTPKTGRVYRRGNKTHIASSPGNPPAIDPPSGSSFQRRWCTSE